MARFNVIKVGDSCEYLAERLESDNGHVVFALAEIEGSESHNLATYATLAECEHAAREHAKSFIMNAAHCELIHAAHQAKMQLIDSGSHVIAERLYKAMEAVRIAEESMLPIDSAREPVGADLY